MNSLRRKSFQFAAILAATLLVPLRAWTAWNKEAFGSKTAADALKGLGIAASTESREILIEAPQIAENGAVVPIEVTSQLPNTRSIALVVDKNPFPLVAKFDFAEAALPYVKVNVKLGESSFVRVYAEAGGRHYSAAKEVKVTIGGCGG
jgi:sulfur-oxidizing protein SoxY